MGKQNKKGDIASIPADAYECQGQHTNDRNGAHLAERRPFVPAQRGPPNQQQLNVPSTGPTVLSPQPALPEGEASPTAAAQRSQHWPHRPESARAAPAQPAVPGGEGKPNSSSSTARPMALKGSKL